ncbi:MAG: hypothetical protein ACKVS6_01325 [Planctomycetota bacterium]
MKATLGLLVIAVAIPLACSTSLPSQRAGMLANTQVQKSTDGGDSWNNVASSGSCTGNVNLFADSTGFEAYRIVSENSSIEYMVARSIVPVEKQRMLENAFVAASEVSVEWNLTGELVGISK